MGEERHAKELVPLGTWKVRRVTPLNKQKLLADTEVFVRKTMDRFGPSHDWNHVDRVRSVALALADQEGANKLVVELAALLHDIDDYKFSDRQKEGDASAEEWLESQNVDQELIQEIITIIQGISFKGGGEKDPELSVEGCCVRDSDRLEAMGAIGIARAFSFGGHRDQVFHDPSVGPKVDQGEVSYKAGGSNTTINHFYEKSLLLRDRMGTSAGRRIAEDRHRIIVWFLEQFEKEWNGGDWKSSIHESEVLKF